MKVERTSDWGWIWEWERENWQEVITLSCQIQCAQLSFAGCQMARILCLPKNLFTPGIHM